MSSPAIRTTDTVVGMGGNDTIAGGDGIDTAVYTGNRADYTLSINSGRNLDSD